ncbi:glycerol-3-phosphate acyltransferase [Paenibacillus naphthalenovorans]|uniref:Glycerol-3-phosphate acyltransferase n=1 Tax=Paenibacillus naphthalenovorans TaxID=162209 RepID=A0A0U2ILZ4_9BACL|nr:glycerol-3-phosphate acyltransferase [Paenibacillus naphthalenovorans]ALS21739.1 glycerol-3-phosphate acyltransferase [Paenibacillus naphthalenovorans]
MQWMEASMLVLNYLLGGFFAGYWIVRLKDGRDLRTLGSGNAGARNAGRSLIGAVRFYMV